jgi:galactokinase
LTSPERFRELFGTAPTAVVRAPGRVNLIGEHIDYAGLPVLPMAIERRITLYVGPGADGRVRIVNACREHGEREFYVEQAIPPWPAGDWGNYPKAAVQGLVDDGLRPTGFDALLSSDLPPAAGLSSSSALVVAVALGALSVQGSQALPEVLELAALLANAEQYVGARGGGMDQAAILAGRAGFASHVAFDPLRVEWIPVPDGWSFVVAHSLATAEKSGAARDTYNRRRDEVERALAAPTGELPEPLRQRLRHVVSEAERVVHAVEALRSTDIDTFGRLMLASHESLRADFEVSTPALDALVRSSMDCGAVGARLTGAGLGGCVLALVPSQALDGFLERLHAAFYEPRGMPHNRSHVFAVRPAPGASVARV